MIHKSVSLKYEPSSEPLHNSGFCNDSKEEDDKIQKSISLKYEPSPEPLHNSGHTFSKNSRDLSSDPTDLNPQP